MSKKIPIVSIKLVKESNLPIDINKSITSPQQAYEIFKYLLEERDRELFCVLAVNTQNKPCYVEVVSKGTVDQSFIHPREVYKSAILSNASNIFLAHNHPSGDCKASLADIEVTEKLIQVGNFLNIPVLDHIIVGDEKFISMKEKGMCNFNLGIQNCLSKNFDIPPLTSVKENAQRATDKVNANKSTAQRNLKRSNEPER